MAFIKFSVFTEFRLFEETNNHPFRKRGSLGYKLGNFGYFHINDKRKTRKARKSDDTSSRASKDLPWFEEVSNSFAPTEPFRHRLF